MGALWLEPQSIRPVVGCVQLLEPVERSDEKAELLGWGERVGCLNTLSPDIG